MSVDPPKYSGHIPKTTNTLKGSGLNPKTLMGDITAGQDKKVAVPSSSSTSLQFPKLTSEIEATVTNYAKATIKQLSVLLKSHPELFTKKSQNQTQTQTQTRENTNSSDVKSLKANGKVELFLTELSIAGQKKIVVTKTPLTIGQQLILSSNKVGQQHQQSKTTTNGLYAKPATPVATTKLLPSIIYESMRQSLPKQSPVSNIIQLATFVMKQTQTPTGNTLNNNANNVLTSPDLLNLLAKLSLAKIDKGSLNPEKIKTFLKNSGTLLEATLHNTKTKGEQRVESQDTKALLLIIKSIIEKDSKARPKQYNQSKKNDLVQQLYQQTMSSLAKIQFNQTRSLAENHSHKDDNQNLSNHLFTELPIKWEQNILPMTLELWEQQEKEAEAEKEKKGGSYWHVNLEFNLPDNNKLYAHIKAKNQKVNINLWSSSDSHILNLRQQSKKLEHQLKNHGIEVEKIQVSSGQPNNQKKPFDLSLIDIRT